VLPLENLTGRPEDEFFADGMTDALITELARDPALRVISRQSAMAFKGSRQGLTEVGGALGAEVLVEGSVTRSNGRVRITTQLVRVEEETHVWAGRFDRPLEDVLDVHADVAETVAREVCAALGRARDQSAAVRSSGHRPVDPAAYEAYLKGRYFSAMLPEIPRAIELPDGTRAGRAVRPRLGRHRHVLRQPRAVRLSLARRRLPAAEVGGPQGAGPGRFGR